MRKYIEVDELKESFIYEEDSDYSLWTLAGILHEIDEIEPADVEEVRHGHWVYEKGDCFPKCSVCRQHHGTLFEHYYCPVCGAKMSLGE